MNTPIKNLFLLPALMAGLGFIPAGRVTAQNFTTLHTFLGYPSEGSFPYAGLILSGSTLYGTTTGGGSADFGTVFKVNTDGTDFTNLHSFAPSSGPGYQLTNSDGANPEGGLI